MRALVASFSVAAVALLGWQGNKTPVNVAVDSEHQIGALPHFDNTRCDCGCEPITADFKWHVQADSTKNLASLIYAVLPLLWDAVSCGCVILQVCKAIAMYNCALMKSCPKYMPVCKDKGIQTSSWARKLANARVATTSLQMQVSQAADERDAYEKEARKLAKLLRKAHEKIDELVLANENKSTELRVQANHLNAYFEQYQELAFNYQQLQMKEQMLTGLESKPVEVPVSGKKQAQESHTPCRDHDLHNTHALETAAEEVSSSAESRQHAEKASESSSRSSSVADSTSTQPPRGQLQVVAAPWLPASCHDSTSNGQWSVEAAQDPRPQHPCIPSLRLAERIPAIRGATVGIPSYRKSPSNESLSTRSSLSTATSNQSCRLASRK